MYVQYTNTSYMYTYSSYYISTYYLLHLVIIMIIISMKYRYDNDQYRCIMTSHYGDQQTACRCRGGPIQGDLGEKVYIRADDIYYVSTLYTYFIILLFLVYTGTYYISGCSIMYCVHCSKHIPLQPTPVQRSLHGFLMIMSVVPGGFFSLSDFFSRVSYSSQPEFRTRCN